MKKIKRLFGIILAVAMIFSGVGVDISKTESAYAGESPSAYISTIKVGMSLNITYFSAENENNKFTFWVPDTAMPNFKYFADKNKDGNDQLYYQVKVKTNGTENASIISQITQRLLGLLPSHGIQVTNLNGLPVGKTVEKTLVVGQYDTKTKAFKEETTQEYAITFNRKVMLTNISASDDLGNNLTLNTTLNQYQGDTYSIRVSEDAKTLKLNCIPKTTLAEYDTEGKLVKAGTIINYGSATSAVTEDENTFDISKLPTTSEGKKYIPVKLEYMAVSEENAEGIAPANVQGTEYIILVETGNYIPTATTENADKYEYDRAEKNVTPLSVDINIAEEAKGTISYQWYSKTLRNSSIGDGFSIVKDATSSTYTPPTEYVSEKAYKCRVTNTVSGVAYSADSKQIEVIIKPTSASTPEITKEPEDASCLVGETAQLTVKASSNDYGGWLTYQWYQADDKNGNSATALIGETKNSLSVFVSEVGEKYFYCTVTSTVGWTKDNSGNFVGGVSSSKSSKLVTVSGSKIPGINYFEKDGADGTEKHPYKINNLEDLKKMKELVEKGYGLKGLNFELTCDLELPSDWTPIGNAKDSDKITTLPDGTQTPSLENGANVNPFMGIFDGANHKVTIAEDGFPLFKYVREATVKNLNIYGKKIKTSAIVSEAFIDYGASGDYDLTRTEFTIKIDNCKLLSGSKTVGPGFLPGSGSGSNTVYILNSEVQKDVIVGCDGTIKGGSFIGSLNGLIANSISYATVNGRGGLAGYKGQSMGACVIMNSAFCGTLVSDTYAGGIIGSGYNGYAGEVNSAPNTPVVSIRNCYVVADITGKGNVGGILGTEPSCECCWDNGRGTVSNNYFYGKLTETSGEGNVGGIVGFMKSFDKYQGFDSNFYYIKNNESTTGIGKIDEIITKDHPKYGATYGIDYKFDEKTVCTEVTESSLKDETLAAKLNAGKYSTKNWTQGKDGYPILSEEPVIYQLTLSDYKTDYKVGEKFDTTGMKIIGTYTDGRTEEIPLKDVEFSTLDTSKAANVELTARYLAAEAKFTVEVRYEAPKVSKVSILILGDTKHDTPTEATGTHTLSSNNLTKWYEGSFELNQNNTVWDLLKRVQADSTSKISFSNPMGNYVDKVTYGTLTLGEFDNGNLSGWMYTLNGTHPNLGVSEQFLNTGDRIVWHYTDDYTKEEGSDKWGVPGAVEEVKEVTTDKAASTTTSPTDVKVSEKTNADGTKESVATVTVSADNQKEILAQAKANKSKEIILQVSKDSVKDATKADVQLDKSFIESVLKDTDAKLTVKTPFGDKTYTQDELKALAAAATGKTVSLEIVKSEKTDEELKAEQLEAAKATVAKASMKARSTKTAKGNVKVVFKPDTKTQNFINEMKDMGYTVKYRFYRSTKKSSGYKAMLTKTSKTYTNTSGKKGTKYYYKVQVRVYDENGKCVAKTALKQCKYACRTWAK